MEYKKRRIDDDDTRMDVSQTQDMGSDQTAKNYHPTRLGKSRQTSDRQVIETEEDVENLILLVDRCLSQQATFLAEYSSRQGRNLASVEMPPPSRYLPPKFSGSR
jgi:hypothetical protein